jgi:hypothetical protein
VRQGADRAPLAERGVDLYETPQCAIRALLRVESLPHVLWEPCAGRGAISRELKAAGHTVVTTDLCWHPGADSGIIGGVDFLLERAPPPDVAAIVTNPPFMLADKFIRHGLALGLPVIVLLRLMALEGAGRSDLIDRHLRRVWAGIERLPKFQREGWTGKTIATETAPYAWYRFEPESREGSAIELRRMSWRE